MDRPVVIEARGLHKTFRVPDQRVDSFRERFTKPFTRVGHREFTALRDVSFEVGDGEFFGIVGRNGSGKSTLLKILASIYGLDSGRVRTAGRIAPFIELGVGFNPELAAGDNTVLNGVLLGLTRREAQRRRDAVLDFAELQEFADLKLKNYSSGMLVRLAFAIMVQADADIMLIDEVLAVGDAAFARKCLDFFQERKRQGRTVILVTHDMVSVQSLCHRAMLLERGEVQYVGDPEEAALRYFRNNFAREAADFGGRVAVPDFNTSILSARLVDAAGEVVENLEAGTPIAFEVELEARRDLPATGFIFHLRNESNVTVAGFSRDVDHPIADGERISIAGSVENRLVPGRYSLDCWLRRIGESEIGVQGLRLVDFVVYGAGEADGIVSLDADVSIETGSARA